jgi:hypothetical protein
MGNEFLALKHNPLASEATHLFRVRSNPLELALAMV